MNKTRILSILFLIIAVCLAYYLGRKIYEPIERQEEITRIELEVAEQLKMLRDAQKEYITANGVYASEWKDLVAFVDTGISYQTSVKEIITPRPIELAYLGDSIRIEIDTLGFEPVREKLFPSSKYPDFDSKKLTFVPGKDFQFSLYVGQVDMGGIPVQVIQVMDPNPEDKRRKKDHEFANRRNLNFGSKQKSTLEGNWPMKSSSN